MRRHRGERIGDSSRALILKPVSICLLFRGDGSSSTVARGFTASTTASHQHVVVTIMFAEANLKSYRGRLAPSPTGLLHVGHARTFWMAAQRAAEHHGQLILRNEDLDSQRCRAEFASAMLEDLRWLGIEWSEGPDCGALAVAGLGRLIVEEGPTGDQVDEVEVGGGVEHGEIDPIDRKPTGGRPVERRVRALPHV